MTTKEFHRTIDSVLARTKIEHCCTKGCCHCCSEPLYVDSREADYLLEGVPAELREQVKENTKRWAEKAQPLLSQNMPNAFAWRWLDNPCPFLIGTTCSVYERRPVGCRVFFAKENPENCKMPAREHQKVASFTPETMAAACAPYFLDQGRVEMDHLGCFLAETLLGHRPHSASRAIYTMEDH